MFYNTALLCHCSVAALPCCYAFQLFSVIAASLHFICITCSNSALPQQCRLILLLFSVSLLLCHCKVAACGYYRLPCRSVAGMSLQLASTNYSRLALSLRCCAVTAMSRQTATNNDEQRQTTTHSNTQQQTHNNNNNNKHASKQASKQARKHASNR